MDLLCVQVPVHLPRIHQPILYLPETDRTVYPNVIRFSLTELDPKSFLLFGFQAGPHYTLQAGFEPVILLPQPHKG